MSNPRWHLTPTETWHDLIREELRARQAYRARIRLIQRAIDAVIWLGLLALVAALLVELFPR